ncbi:putative basic amino acid antiporter YfcC [Ferrimonas balearica]|nr:putative basic amino acid antiporter YfcC [Ferrimonas balearica]
MMANNPRPVMPDATVLLCLVAVLAWGLTFWVPAGTFDVVEVAGQRQLMADSYQAVPAQPAALFNQEGGMGLLNLLFEGLVAGTKWGSTIGIAAFLLVVGGAFGVVLGTGSLDRGIAALMARQSAHQDLLLPLLFFLFSLGGAVFGMGEEAIAFCLILVPALVRMGYDSLSAVACCYLATQLGFATSWMNPFSVAIAQGIAGLPLLSGASYRLALWAGFTLLGMVFVWHYGRGIRLQPERSLSYASDGHWRRHSDHTDDSAPRLAGLDKAVLLLLCAGVIWIGWGVMTQGYYLPQIAAQFFTLALVIGLLGRTFGQFSNLNQLSQHFSDGAAALVPAVIVVALAKGVVLLLGGDDPSQPSVLNTLLHHSARTLDGMGQTASAASMFWFQSGLNLVVSSGSGQAALTMPLMAPLADLLGLSRQVAVLAFQLGDGLTNVLVPTSASLVGCLAVARTSWGNWLRFIGPFMAAVMALATLAVIVATWMGYQ